MSTEIYYFSGTGNSFSVAKDIARHLEGTLIPIASLINIGSVTTDAEVVGIVFPVYYGELPVIVKEFASKLSLMPQTHTFAVCTFGGAASASLREIRKILRLKGSELSAGYGIHMPQNSFYKPNENHKAIFAEWKKRLPKVISHIKVRGRGLLYSNLLLEWLMVPLQPMLIRPVCRNAFLKETKLPESTKMDHLVRTMDIGFSANDRCNGCGVCARVCPVNNIKIDNNKPKWLHQCENCLACYNWCPKQAIEGGITKKDYYYRHPETTVSEIISQKTYQMANENSDR